MVVGGKDSKEKDDFYNLFESILWLERFFRDSVCKIIVRSAFFRSLYNHLLPHLKAHTCLREK